MTQGPGIETSAYRTLSVVRVLRTLLVDVEKRVTAASNLQRV